MRPRLIWLLALSWAGLLGCREGGSPSPAPAPKPAPPLFAAHFLGTTQLAADTNAAPWVTLGALPASQALLQETIEKLARAPYQLVHRRAATTNDFSPVFQVLMRDLLHAESFVQVTGDTNRIDECELAVRLPADRQAYWETNLQAIAEAWTACRGAALATTNLPGWELKKHHEPNLVRCVRSRGWTLVGCGQDRLPLQEQFLRQIKLSGSPATAETNAWLEVAVDTPGLPFVAKRALLTGLPDVRARVTGQGNNLRTEGELVYRDTTSWTLSPWLLPTNLIHEPIISFTAVRGIGASLQRLALADGFKADACPDQVFGWAIAGLPMLTFAVAPLSSPTNFLREVGPQFAARFNPALLSLSLGSIAHDPNSGVTSWRGVPFVGPNAVPLLSHGISYVGIGLMPIPAPLGPAPPPELFAQVTSDTNLVYYDWELTPARLRHWSGLWDLGQMLFRQPRLATNQIATNWLSAISTNLGNTATRVTRTQANRLTFARSGTLGMTGIELVALVSWIQSLGFPLAGYALPPHTNAQTFIPALPR